MEKELNLSDEYILEIKNLNVFSSKKEKHIINNLSVSIVPNAVIAVIGPLYSGKSILLKSINRLNELNPEIKTEGKIFFRGQNIKTIKPFEVRKKIGMIFKNPQIFHNMSIEENVLAGYTLNRISLSKEKKDEILYRSLQDVYLWEDFKDDLNKKPDTLSKGEQQRLCIARAIALEPDIILMDEPTSFMSNYCSNRIEDMINKYKEKHTIIVVTPNLSQAARISDYTLYIDNGSLIEYGTTTQLFWNPVDRRTEKYITNQMD